jgi:hypothetical protein
MRRRTFLGGLAGAAIAPNAWAQTELRGAQIVSDIALLREAYETLHPGLYSYASPAAVSARFDALARLWSTDQTCAEAYASLSRFLATIQCGHTYANFYNQRRAVAEELFAGANRLPFHFAWIGERMVVLRNFSGDARLVPGAEILSINGRSTQRILRDLLPLVRADGGNDDKRRALLDVRGLDRFETFDCYYPLLFPDATDGFRIRARALDESTLRLDLAPIDLATRRSAMAPASQDQNAPAWTLTFPADRAALLTMPNWALYNSTWDWRSFLDDSFAEIVARGVTRLVVDLRGNEGGLDCGNEIIARSIDRDLALAAYQRRVRYRRTPDHLNAHLDTWDDSFRDWGAQVEPIDDRYFRFRDDGTVQVIAPKGPRFRGELRVLIDASNSSATFQFANVVRDNALGRLIGAPTGGNLRGINGGAFFFLRLPASGLEADLPLIGTFPHRPMPNAGIAPDLHVAADARDIARNHDRVLAAALA